MKNKNVLHLVEYLYLGGIERLLEQMSNKMDPYTKLFFFTYETEELKGIGKNIRDKGHTVFTYKKKTGRDFALVKELAKVIRENKIDVVHTHDFGPIEYAVLVKILSPWVKLVHTQHTMHHFIIHRRYRYFFQFASYFYSSIIGVSSFVKDSLIEHCPFTNRFVLKVIPNGVDTDLFLPSGPSEDKNELSLVCVARMSHEKNLEYLFNTCRLLKEANIPFTLHHAGTAKKVEIIRQHEDYIEKNGLSENIVLHGFVDDTKSILAKGNIFISTSKREGHPVAVLEAMSCELHCVCSDIPPHREISKGEIALYDLCDEFALFNRLKEIYESKQSLVPRNKNAREIILRHFSLQTMVDQYVQEY